MAPAKKPTDKSTFSGRFAAGIRSLRESLGLTGQQATAQINTLGYAVTATTYYRWESGESEPPLDAFPVLCAVFNLEFTSDLIPKEKVIKKATSSRKRS